MVALLRLGVLSPRDGETHLRPARATTERATPSSFLRAHLSGGLPREGEGH